MMTLQTTPLARDGRTGCCANGGCCPHCHSASETLLADRCLVAKKVLGTTQWAAAGLGAGSALSRAGRPHHRPGRVRAAAANTNSKCRHCKELTSRPTCPDACFIPVVGFRLWGLHTTRRLLRASTGWPRRRSRPTSLGRTWSGGSTASCATGACRRPCARAVSASSSAGASALAVKREAISFDPDRTGWKPATRVALALVEALQSARH